MALLRQPFFTSTPFRTTTASGMDRGSDPSRVLWPPDPLHWTPTPALSISISFLSQYVSRWRPMQDRCFNIGSALTYNNYRSVESLFKASTLGSPRLLSLSRRLCGVIRATVWRVFRRRIQEPGLTLMKVALSLIRNWSSLFNSTSIGHCYWASRGDAAGMRWNKNKTTELFGGSFWFTMFIACSWTFSGASSHS